MPQDLSNIVMHKEELEPVHVDIDLLPMKELKKINKTLVSTINKRKKNRVGADLPHYQVLWDNSSRLTEIQAHRIEHEVA